MDTKIPDLQPQMLRMGSIAFLAGIVIILASTLIHPSREDPANHPLVFAEYAEDNLWIAAHLGQFAGVMLVLAGGFVALHRLLLRSESGVASALAWFGLVAAIITASTFTILQAVDGVALKIAVDTWYVIPSTADSEEEKAIAFRVAEGIRWIEIGINSYFRIFQGTVAVLFGVAIAMSKLLSKWIGGLGIFAGAATITAGVGVAYEGFSTSQALLSVVSTVIYLAWLVILGIFMWRKTREKKMIAR
jgi:Domain of unknown function (DUF4386)